MTTVTSGGSTGATGAPAGAGWGRISSFDLIILRLGASANALQLPASAAGRPVYHLSAPGGNYIRTRPSTSRESRSPPSIAEPARFVQHQAPPHKATGPRGGRSLAG